MRRIFFAVATALVAGVCPAVASADSNQEFSQGIAQALRDSGRLVDYNIGVTSNKGVVSLKGRVASKEQLQEAMQMASSMPGVSKVVNRLQVKPTAPARQRLSKTEQAAANLAADAQRAAEEAMTSMRTTMFADPSVPAASSNQAALAAKLRASQASIAASQQAASGNAFAVRQVSQNVPRSFTPADSTQLTAPQAPAPPIGPRLAMAPVAAAAGLAAGAMGADCPPGGGGYGGPGYGGPGYGPGGGGRGGPLPMAVPGVGGGVAPTSYDQPYMPNYAWPSYAAYPNYGAVTYPRQYSPTAWPYIGPFYPYPQVPLGWRKVTLEWDDGWWMLNFKD
ncbi:MAG: BON domain-containing protein [Planctomycetia bacterium]|nr:BON domain-containing protein [Planctomycetia bacterium]